MLTKMGFTEDDFDTNIQDTAKVLGAKGLSFEKVENDQWKSPVLKILSDEEKSSLAKEPDAQNRDTVFFPADKLERA